jgi:hypothetical protein
LRVKTDKARHTLIESIDKKIKNIEDKIDRKE